MRSADHDMPPFVVATTTVADPAGMVALGPGTPTAQQRRASAHDTAPSWPVWPGDGWPTARVVPFTAPSTFFALGAPGWFPREQADAVTASAASRTGGPPRRPERRCRGTMRGGTTAEQ